MALNLPSASSRREAGGETGAAFSDPLQEIPHAQFVFVTGELARPSA